MDRFNRWRQGGPQMGPLWRTLEDMRTEFEQAMGPGSTPAGHWSPLVDVFEVPEALVIQVELPGVKQDDIQIHLEGNELTLSGERRYAEPGGQVHRIERTYGTFQRTFQLPLTVQRDGVKAVLREGVLTLRIPKAEAAKPRAIQVQIEE